MPKIVKNGLEYSGTPLEEVTAWPPTGDSVQIEQPLMGNTDISSIGDGTVTGAISELNNGLTVKTYELTSTTNYYGNVDVPTNIVRPSTGAILSCSNDGNSKAFAPIGVKTSDKYVLRFYNYATTTSDVVANTSVTVTIYYILYI